MIHYCMLWYINTLDRLHPFFAWHKRGERVFREALRGRGIFFTVVGISKVILWQADSFLKLKHPRNIQYWLIKISMKYGSIGHVVQKSYSNEVCVGWLHENCCLVGEMNLWWEGNENLMRGGEDNLQLMHSIVSAQASTHTTGLMHLKNYKHHFYSKKLYKIQQGGPLVLEFLEFLEMFLYFFVSGIVFEKHHILAVVLEMFLKSYFCLRCSEGF